MTWLSSSKFTNLGGGSIGPQSTPHDLNRGPQNNLHKQLISRPEHAQSPAPSQS